jgi:hypothetical protein
VIYQRGRIWYADFYVDGKRVQESTGAANKREAEKFEALRISDAQRGVYGSRTSARPRFLRQRKMQGFNAHSNI